MTDKEKFEQYVNKINEVMRSGEFYNTFQRRLRASKPQLKLAKKSRTKQFETDWIDMIESCITNLDNIVRNPRKFIVIEEDIVDISLARAISTESVKHLAQHTNLIASVDKDGNVTPNKILNTTKEESFEIYENRFIYTLLRNLSNFITRRMDAIKKAYVNDNIMELDVNANFFMGKTRVFYNLELIGSMPSNAEEEIQGADLDIVERVTKLQRIISDFLSSPFAKQMVNSAPVRPPITRTNVILKNPDFKKALVLWQFIESYTKMGFSVENVSEKVDISQEVETAVSDMLCFGNLLMESLVNAQVEDSAFFEESNITETEQQPEEVKTDEAEEQAQETQEPEQAPEEIPEQQPEEQPQPEEVPEEQEEEQPQPEEQPIDEDEELPADFGIAEVRNMFQQTDNKLDKAQITRINKGIDRILAQERSLKNANKTKTAQIQFRQQEIEQDEMLKQMEKEKQALQRSLAKKEKIAQRERELLAKQQERDKQRLQELEREMQEKLLQQQQKQQQALQDGIKVDDDVERQQLEDVEDLSIMPMQKSLGADTVDGDFTLPEIKQRPTKPQQEQKQPENEKAEQKTQSLAKQKTSRGKSAQADLADSSQAELDDTQQAKIDDTQQAEIEKSQEQKQPSMQMAQTDSYDVEYNLESDNSLYAQEEKEDEKQSTTVAPINAVLAQNFEVAQSADEVEDDTKDNDGEQVEQAIAEDDKNNQVAEIGTDSDIASENTEQIVAETTPETAQNDNKTVVDDSNETQTTEQSEDSTPKKYLTIPIEGDSDDDFDDISFDD